MSEFAPLEQALDGLLARMSPSGRKALANRIAIDLRRARAANIAANEEPDGSAMVPRKDPAPARLRKRAGQLREKARERMFRKAGSARFLQRRAGADGLEVGFAGAMARIMRVHQEGLRDTVTRRAGAPEVQYPERQVLGFTDADRAALLERVAEHLKL